MTTKTILRFSLLCASLAIGCDDGSADRDAPRVASVDDAAVETGVPGKVALAAPAEHTAAAMRRSPPMPGAKQAFDKVSALLAEHYVGGAPSEDELWTGAIDGVLARLPQRTEHPANVLMSPQEKQELIIGTKGKLVGVGIMIERVADVVVIKEVIADGPAAKAGLQAGDRILGVDGTRVRELELGDVVARVRGEEGTAVALFVQRDTEEWNLDITRGQVHIDSVQSATLGDGMGYLRITSFAMDTATELDAKIDALRQGGVTRIVLDLRDCPGGLLDATVGVAERFLPPGKTILTIERRGGSNEVVATKEDHRGKPMTFTVLIGPHTASSAEILADALHHHGEATLVGDTTFGKHTIESIHELEGGWAVKFSVSRFITASGVANEGEGVKPDIRIPSDPERKFAGVDALAPDEDPTLAAAMELLDRG